MSTISIGEIKKSYFLLGSLSEISLRKFESELNSFDDNLHIIPIKNYGYHSFTLPFYADKAETDELIRFKLGNFHDGERLISTEEILNYRWVTNEGLNYDDIKGDGALICIYKIEPRISIYRDIISASGILYLHQKDLFITSDNLRIASLF